MDWDPEIFAFYQQCISIRKKHSALRTGEWKTLWAKDDLMVYQLKNETETVLVGINRASGMRKAEIRIGAEFADGTILQEEFRRSQQVVKEGILSLEFAPYSGVVYSK